MLLFSRLRRLIWDSSPSRPWISCACCDAEYGDAVWPSDGDDAAAEDAFADGAASCAADCERADARRYCLSTRTNSSPGGPSWSSRSWSTGRSGSWCCSPFSISCDGSGTRSWSDARWGRASARSRCVCVASSTLSRKTRKENFWLVKKKRAVCVNQFI